jgi:sigma-B regulation protein RsbU (phosphoserine phosphatase)
MNVKANPVSDLFGPNAGDRDERLTEVVQVMREISLHTDPEEMVQAYGSWIRKMILAEGYLSMSRRGLEFPQYRITRSSLWSEPINPWTEKDRLPLLEGGILAELIYGNEPRILSDFDVVPDDPAFAYLDGHRSLMAIPNFDQGLGLNMTVRLSTDPDAFDLDTFPEHVWMSNLFGRATQNLALSEELKRAYTMVDRELKHVADIQKSLLPKEIPNIPTLDLAAFYQTSQWAGGDYYDFFTLPDGKFGLLIADVSGHGTPAAVLMAITHSIAHSYPGPPASPGELLAHVNQQLSTRYTVETGTFVTAFYGIYDPSSRELTYACAGHNPPRLKRCEDGTVASLDGVSNLPLGLFPDLVFEETTQKLIPGDQVIFYTDGITEAVNQQGDMFGLNRLDEVLENCHLSADGLIEEVLRALEIFTADAPATDDRTLLVAKVS